MLQRIANRFRATAPAADFWSLRLVDRHRERPCVRQGVLQPWMREQGTGALVFVVKGTGYAYAATCDLSPGGLAGAAAQALAQAEANAPHTLLDPGHHAMAHSGGDYHSPIETAWEDWGVEDKIAFLHAADARLRSGDAIIDHLASLDYRHEETLLVTAHGARIHQSFDLFTPGLIAVANRGANTQRRSFGLDQGHQGGLEWLGPGQLLEEAQRVGEEALELLHAPDCPNARMDLLLMPGQMILQIHESIGHALELDRILGDERNYAGTSFVTPEMFGHYRYGSELLNVSFDPTCSGELASYGFDDAGTAAQRIPLIRNGILLRALGGVSSQRRAGVAGAACARACDWNRPAIDRMANLNLEAGESHLGEMIGAIEYGVLMDTNRSWSIDQRRNKFQFGCEYARLIEGGALKGVVKNPSYRGTSTPFWRSLAMTGDRDTYRVMGVAGCGKGEPNQAIAVGHASPACVFRDIDVFAG